MSERVVYSVATATMTPATPYSISCDIYYVAVTDHDYFTNNIKCYGTRHHVD